MKKIFQIIGLISLVCFSFFITDKTATVVNDMDEIMINIKENYENYKSESVDAIIKDNTIIPGLYGKEVNINKSYKNMKENGYYSENAYIYNYTKPKISINDNLDKYIISGNKNKRMVSLLFIVNNNDTINNIVKVVNNNDIKVNFFIDNNFLSENNDLINNLIKNNHIIGSLESDYTTSTFGWMDTIIKKVGNQKYGYCYNLVDNNENLKSCSNLKNYTIRPNIVTTMSPLIDIKENLAPGSLIALNINSNLEIELQNIINYIKSKGYIIANLEEHLSEK